MKTTHRAAFGTGLGGWCLSRNRPLGRPLTRHYARRIRAFGVFGTSHLGRCRLVIGIERELGEQPVLVRQVLPGFTVDPVVVGQNIPDPVGDLCQRDAIRRGQQKRKRVIRDPRHHPDMIHFRPRTLQPTSNPLRVDTDQSRCARLVAALRFDQTPYHLHPFVTHAGTVTHEATRQR